MIDKVWLRNKLSNRVNTLKVEVQSKKEIAKQKEKMVERKDEYEALLQSIKDEERKYKQAESFVIRFQNSKKEKDSEAIKNAMKIGSEIILDNKSIEPEFSTSNGKYPETKVVTKINGKPVLLELTEGTGLNESVSMLTNISVLSSTDYAKILLSDEWFASVSPINSIKLSGTLNPLFDGKIQALMIEQKDEIFQNASYREFFLEFDGKYTTVTTYDVDVYGNKTLVE